VKNSILAFLLLLSLASTAFPQAQPQPFRAYSAGGTVPSSCTAPALFYKTSTTQGLYQCVAGVYIQLANGGAGGAVSGTGVDKRLAVWNGSGSLTSNAGLTYDYSTNELALGNGGSFTLSGAGAGLKMSGSVSGTLAHFVPGTITTYALTWPSAQGAANTFLKNNGSGTLSFAQTTLTTDVTGTLPVANGGTGVASATAYALLAGGTTSTGAFQSLAGLGTAGQVLTSNGAGALPTFQTSSGISGLTTGTIPKAASATSLNDSLFSQSGSNIIEQKSSTTAQTLRVYRTTTGTHFTFLGDTSSIPGSGPSGMGAGTYGGDTFKINVWNSTNGTVKEWAFDQDANFASTSGGQLGDSNYAFSALYLGSTSVIYWGSNHPYLTRLLPSATASPELGFQIGSIPVGQTDQTNAFGIRQADAPPSTSNNLAVGPFTFSAGKGQGTAIPTRIHFRAGAANQLSSGTTPHTNVERLILNGQKNLTDNTATTLVVFTLAAGTGSGGSMDYLVEASDGTDIQSESGHVVFSFVNKGGTYTTGISSHDTQNTPSSGTLAVTWDITTGSSLVNVRVNANSSLTPTLLRITYTCQNLGQQDVSIQ
jgi:hypothetical protein